MTVVLLGSGLVMLPGSAQAAAPASVAVSKATGLDPAGETITVTGTGFDPAAHVGTRPPLAGQQSGVYVVFGRVSEVWQPSAGAPATARQGITAPVWALPAASR